MRGMSSDAGSDTAGDCTENYTSRALDAISEAVITEADFPLAGRGARPGRGGARQQLRTDLRAARIMGGKAGEKPGLRHRGLGRREPERLQNHGASGSANGSPLNGSATAGDSTLTDPRSATVTGSVVALAARCSASSHSTADR